MSTDPIDAAIAATPITIPAKKFDFAVQTDAGQTKPVSITLPADLSYEELVAVLDGVNHIGQRVVQEAKPKSGLVLAKGPLNGARL